MKGISRRRFSMAGLGLVASGACRAERFTRTLGAELYTVRDLLPTAADQTLRSVAEIGYREVETDHETLLRIAPLLKQYGLKPVSCHIPTPIVTGDWKAWGSITVRTTLDQAMEDVKKAGGEYIVMAYVRPEERGDGEYYKQLADKMNHTGSQARGAGLKFCYHNHAFEFKGARGQRPIDILLSRLDREAAALELDVFWVSVAGEDPVEMLKQNSGRTPLVHLKDKAKGAPVVYEEGVARETFKEVGAGSLNFAAILKAAAAAGTRHYFVEQDQTPGDPVASLKQSYEYLRSL